MNAVASMKKDVLISIVNGNCSGLVQEAVESICAHVKGCSYDIVVIDNATGYSGLPKLDEFGVEVIVNSSPIGFAHNHSQVLGRLGKYRYLLLFNDDAFLINDAVTLMLRVMDEDSQIAISGCYIEDMEGCIQPNAAPHPGIGYFVTSLLGMDRKKNERYSRFFSDYIDYGCSQDVDWVTGCIMMIRADYITRVGFLDQGYFMYMEDADYCRGAWLDRYRVRYIAEARARHYGGLSSRTDGGKISPRIFVERQRSRLKYLRKYAPLQWVLYVLFINVFIASKYLIQHLRGETSRASALKAAIGRMPIY